MNAKILCNIEGVDLIIKFVLVLVLLDLQSILLHNFEKQDLVHGFTFSVLVSPFASILFSRAISIASLQIYCSVSFARFLG